MPLSQNDYDMMTEAVGLLRQFEDFDYFREMSDVIGRLQDTMAISKREREPIVDFEHNSNLEGLKYLNPLYNYIASKQSIKVLYQPFGQDKPREWTIFPYLLKEISRMSSE